MARNIPLYSIRNVDVQQSVASRAESDIGIADIPSINIGLVVQSEMSILVRPFLYYTYNLEI